MVVCVSYHILCSTVATTNSDLFPVLFHSSTNLPSNNWGYQVIETLIEEEKREARHRKVKPYQTQQFKYPMAPIQVDDVDYDEDYSDQSKGQQSQEKPLRMYYAGDGADDEGLSIENYINAKLDRSHELDHDEQYLRRRNSIETESEVLSEVNHDIRDQTGNGGKVKIIKEMVETKIKGTSEKSGHLKGSNPINSSSSHQGKTQKSEKSSNEQEVQKPKGNKASLKELPQKQPVASEEVDNSSDDFDPIGLKTFENDPDIHALIVEADVPTDHALNENFKKVFPQGRGPLLSTLDKRKNLPTRPTSAPRNPTSLPYPAHYVTSGSPHRDMFSFEMLSNNKPSAPLVFKTNLRQTHAQRVNPTKDNLKHHVKGKLGYPAKRNKCKQQGKAHNHLSCLDSDLKTPEAISYQQQEFFRSPGS